MGFRGLTVATAFLFIIQNYEVSAQYATVMECLPQAAAAIARPIVQSAGQYVLPAIIQPVLSGYDCCSPDLAPCYPNYGNYPAPYPGLPPIIVDKDDDFFHHLLYFLIIAMKNKKGNNCNTPPSYSGCNSCNCGCSGGCKCSCDCSNSSKSCSDNSGPTYIPIPVAIPVYTAPDGCRYIEGFCDDILVQGCSGQCAKDEINVIIRTE